MYSVQCFNVKLEEPLTEEQAATLTWLLRETFEPELLSPDSGLRGDAATDAVVEVTPWLINCYSAQAATSRSLSDANTRTSCPPRLCCVGA